MLSITYSYTANKVKDVTEVVVFDSGGARNSR